jgi:hypothetical protein
MIAHTFLAVTTAHARTPAPTDQPTTSAEPAANTNDQAAIPLTCNEIRHLRATLTRPRHNLTHTARWSRFRRQHQHRARLCHYQRRQQRDHDLLL